MVATYEEVKMLAEWVRNDAFPELRNEPVKVEVVPFVFCKDYVAVYHVEVGNVSTIYLSGTYYSSWPTSVAKSYLVHAWTRYTLLTPNRSSIADEVTFTDEYPEVKLLYAVNVDGVTSEAVAVLSLARAPYASHVAEYLGIRDRPEKLYDAARMALAYFARKNVKTVKGEELVAAFRNALKWGRPFA